MLRPGHVQVLTDDDISTKFHWTRPHMLSSESRAEILWTIPAGTSAGSYRCGLVMPLMLCHSHDPVHAAAAGAVLLQMHLQGVVQIYILGCR